MASKVPQKSSAKSLKDIKHNSAARPWNYNLKKKFLWQNDLLKMSHLHFSLAYAKCYAKLKVHKLYTAWPLNTIPNLRFCFVKRAQNRTLLKRLCWLQNFLNPLWISAYVIHRMIDYMGHKTNYSDNFVIKKLWYLFLL